MNFVKRICKSAALAILCATLVMGFAVTLTGCNVNADVTLIGNLAVSLLNACSALSLSPADVALCTTAAGGIKVAVGTFQTCYTSYQAVKGSGGSALQDFQACFTGILGTIQQTLDGFHITNSQSQNIVIVGINGIIDIIDIIGAFEGVTPPAQLSRLEARRPGMNLRVKSWHANSIHAWWDTRKAKSAGVKEWNTTFCARLSGAAAIKACEVH